MTSHSTSCRLTESKTLNGKKCKFLHTRPTCRSEWRFTCALAGPAELQLPGWTWTICLQSPPACGFQDLGSETLPYANSPWQERHLLASPLLFPVLRACQPPHVLSIFIWIGDQGINPAYTNSIFQKPLWCSCNCDISLSKWIELDFNDSRLH